mgnify:CR=1 FL=1
MEPSPVGTEWLFANRQRSVAIEVQREKVRDLERRAQQRKLDDAVRQVELERGTGGASDLRRKYLELSRQARRRRLDAANAERLEEKLEMRRVQAQQAAVRGEKSRLDRLASAEQAREVWRQKDDNLREKKRLRDKAGMRAGGGYKRPAASQQITETSAKIGRASCRERVS